MSNRYFLPCTDADKQNSAKLVHAVRLDSVNLCDLGSAIRLVKQFLVRNGLRDGARDANDLALATARLLNGNGEGLGVADRARVLLTDMAILRSARSWLLANESCHNWRPPSLEMMLRSDGDPTLVLGQALDRSDIHALSIGAYDLVEDPTLAEACSVELAAARRGRDQRVEAELLVDGVERERERGTVLSFASIFGRRRGGAVERVAIVRVA